MRSFQKLARRFAHINWAIADQAVVSGTNFSTTVLVARFLGMEEFGRFALVWLAVFFAQNLQIALVIQPMMTIGAKQPSDDRAAYFGAVILQQILLALVTTAIVIAGVLGAETFWPEWGLGQAVLPLGALVLAGQLTEFLRKYFYTCARPKTSFLVDVSRYGSQLVLLVTVFLFAGQQAGIPVVLYLLTLAALLGFVTGCFNFGPVRFQRASIRRVAARHWRFSRWLMPLAIANWCRENFVHTAVAAGLGLSELGALRAAQQLVRMVNVLIQAFDNIVPMRAGTAFSWNGFAGLVDFIERFVLRYSFGIVCLLVAIALSGGPLMNLVYGAEYRAYGWLVAAYAAVMVLYLMRNLLAIMMRAMETTVFEFYSSICGAVFVTVCAAPLVARFGMAGAFVTLAAFECIMILSLSFGVQKKHVMSM